MLLKLFTLLLGLLSIGCFGVVLSGMWLSSCWFEMVVDDVVLMSSFLGFFVLLFVYYC